MDVNDFYTNWIPAASQKIRFVQLQTLENSGLYDSYRSVRNVWKNSKKDNRIRLKLQANFTQKPSAHGIWIRAFPMTPSTKMRKKRGGVIPASPHIILRRQFDVILFIRIFFYHKTIHINIAVHIFQTVPEDIYIQFSRLIFSNNKLTNMLIIYRLKGICWNYKKY